MGPGPFIFVNLFTKMKIGLVILIMNWSIISAKKDYYKVLEVDKTASQKDIKKAFRNLALKFHPDKNPGEDTSLKFREIAEAYEVLRDGEKRRQYDQMGHGAWGGSSGGYKPGNFNFDDLFRDFDDDFFKDLRGHFAQHFGNHKMAHESTSGHFDFADVDIKNFFKKPSGFDESDLFGKTSVVTNSQNRPNTKYIWFLRNVRIPNTEYIWFLKMIEY